MSALVFIWLLSMIPSGLLYSTVFALYWNSKSRKKLFRKWDNDYLCEEGVAKFFFSSGLAILTLGFVAAGMFAWPVALGLLLGYAVSRREPKPNVKIKTTTIDDAFRDYKKGK